MGGSEDTIRQAPLSERATVREVSPPAAGPPAADSGALPPPPPPLTPPALADSATVARAPEPRAPTPGAGTVEMTRPAVRGGDTVRRVPAPAAPAGPEGTPREIGPYRIGRELGRGGMGVVYKAFHTTLRRDVALKVMLGADSASEREVRRFLREAEACAALKHSNIVPVHDIGQQEGKYYFSMEFVEGETLLDWCRREKRSVEQIVTSMRKVCEAIAYAHQHGIIHRDLKPHNVMVDRGGEPRVMDFGLAKRTDAQVPGAERTIVGTIMGTPQYMSPEQATGKVDEIDTRSDVYSLGVMLYELLSGRLPLEADSLQALLHKIQNVDPAPLRSLVPGIPWELDVICQKALAKERSQRFQGAREMADDLGRFERKEPILARQASVAYRARKFVQRHRTLSAIAATLLAVLATGGTVSYRRAVARAEAAIARAGRLIAAGEGRFRALAASADGMPPRAALDALKQAADEGEREMREAVAAARIQAVGHPRLSEMETRAARVDDLYAKIDERARDRLAGEEALARRRADAERFVREAAAERAAVDPAAIRDLAGASAAQGRLEAAREKATKAIGLDEAYREAHAEVAAIVAAQTRVAERVARLREREDFARALSGGLRDIEAARALRDRRPDAAGEDPRGLEEIGLAYQRAQVEFERALALGPESAEAREGLVAATLEDAKVAAERKRDFSFARRAAAKVERLAPERVREFRAEVDGLERAARGYEAAVSEGRAEKTRGQWASAMAKFEQALAISPGRGDVQFLYRICEARLRCSEGRHQDELGILAAAARLAGTPEQEAEVEGEQDRAIEELIARAEEALLAGDPGRAAEMVDRVLAIRPENPRATRLHANLAGRQRVAHGMVFVWSGPFRSSLAPEKDTDVAGFMIGETEVANAEFAAFVGAGGYTSPALRALWPEAARPLLERGALSGRDGVPGPAGWAGGRPKPGTEGLPVAGVSWWEAAAYAAWREARLPAEAEWEKAAVWDHRTGEARPRPWQPAEWALWASYFDGSKPRPVRAAVAKGAGGADIFDLAPSGAYGMAGNVHEWVAGLAPGGRAVARGGSFLSRFPERSAPARRFVLSADFRGEHLGFRIAMDAPD